MFMQIRLLLTGLIYQVDSRNEVEIYKTRLVLLNEFESNNYLKTGTLQRVKLSGVTDSSISISNKSNIARIANAVQCHN